MKKNLENSLKKIIALALLILAPTAFGQSTNGFAFTPVDVTTPHVVTVTSAGYISISYSNVVMSGLTLQTNSLGYVTNIAPIFITNVVINEPYSAYRTTVTNYGDSPLAAFQKVNAMMTNASVAVSNNASFLTNLFNVNLTTNLQFTDGNLLNPSTNTLYFTNGILKNATSP